MDGRIALLYISSAAGLIMIAGGIWLIYKQKIYIDRESQQPVEIKTPLGEFKSNYPALALFVLGFFPLVYPIYAVNSMMDYVKVETVRIRGPVQTTAYPVLVYAARAQDSLAKGGEFRVPVPFIGEDNYKLLLVVNGHVFDEVPVERGKAGEDIRVEFRPVIIGATPFQADIRPVSDDFR